MFNVIRWFKTRLSAGEDIEAELLEWLDEVNREVFWGSDSEEFEDFFFAVLNEIYQGRADLDRILSEV